MPRRVWVRGHYRNTRRKNDSGCLVGLAIVILGFFAFAYFIGTYPAFFFTLALLFVIGIALYFGIRWYLRSRRSYARITMQQQVSYQPPTYAYSPQQTMQQQVPYQPTYSPPTYSYPPQQYGTGITQFLSMTPAQFEEAVASLMRQAGLQNVSVVGKTGDDGVDVVAWNGQMKIIAQCKRYAPGKNVGNADLRNFIGAMSFAGATKGWFVTTSAFSEKAKQFAAAYPGTLILLDGNDLIRCFQNYQVIQQYI